MGTERGRAGETAAATYLEERGWRILGRNQRVGARELDLVVIREGVLAFVEVKTRTTHAFGAPLEAVTPRKQKDVFRAAAAWLLEHRIPFGTEIRFDAMSVTPHPSGHWEVLHLPDAWRM